jgi:hypothetical protein
MFLEFNLPFLWKHTILIKINKMRAKKIPAVAPVMSAFAYQQNGSVVNGMNNSPGAMPASIQPKLSIGSADDPLEHEADSMADKVMRMQMPDPINFSSSTALYRKCAHCEEEEKKEVQRKESNGEVVSSAPAIVHDVLNSSGQ